MKNLLKAGVLLLLTTPLFAQHTVQYADLGAKQSSPTAIFAEVLKPNPDHEFRWLSIHQDNAGKVHETYQQYYKGVKVDGGTYTLHGNSAAYDHLSGHFEAVTGLATKATLQPKEALARVMAEIGAKEYAWQNPQAEQWLKNIRKDPTATYLPTAELLISRDWDLYEQKGVITYHLCYAFVIRATQPDLSLRVLVDAHTGHILARQDLVCHATGRGNTLYNGNNVALKTQYLPNTDQYRLYDEQNRIHTLDAQNTANPYGVDHLTDASNYWVAQHPAHDAHYGATKTVEYWKSTHNRVSHDGDPNTVLIQLTDAFTINRLGFPNKDNASWSYIEKVARYGNGQRIFKPLTSLDVVAHEIGHAYSHGLSFNSHSNNQTQALHEGLSDIWASCVDRDNWTVGEQIMNNGASCMRSIINPLLTTAHTRGSVTYGSNSFTYAPTVHAEGLVLAHWFYLLCEGKIGTNELNTSYVVEGIGKEKAEKIVYGMYPYLNTNGWASVANAALQSAKNLYGECSREYACTYNALYAVNLLTVGNKPNIQMSLPTLTATLPADYSVICDGEINNASIAYTWGANTSDRISYEWQISDAFRGLNFIDDMGNTLGNFAFGSQVKFRYIAPTDISEKQYVTITARAYCNGNTAAERRIVACPTN